MTLSTRHLSNQLDKFVLIWDKFLLLYYRKLPEWYPNTLEAQIVYLRYTTLNQLYKTFAKTHLDYCDVIFITNNQQKLQTKGTIVQEEEFVSHPDKFLLCMRTTWIGKEKHLFYRRRINV